MKRPEDMDFMAYADNEAGPDTASRVKAWIAEHPSDAGFVAAFDQVGDWVREVEKAPELPQTFADQVLEETVATTSPPASNVIPLRGTSPGVRIFRIGAVAAVVAAAAAVAMFLGGSSGGSSGGPTKGHLAGLTSAHDNAKSSMGKPPAPGTSAPAGLKGLSLPSRAIEATATRVEEVDFGDHEGTVFYVEGDSPSPTPVVWITDEESGK